MSANHILCSQFKRERKKVRYLGRDLLPQATESQERQEYPYTIKTIIGHSSTYHVPYQYCVHNRLSEDEASGSKHVEDIKIEN
jgi:hypothetical protein